MITWIRVSHSGAARAEHLTLNVCWIAQVHGHVGDSSSLIVPLMWILDTDGEFLGGEYARTLLNRSC